MTIWSVFLMHTSALRLAPRMIWERELEAYRIQNTKGKKVPECLKIKVREAVFGGVGPLFIL